MKISTYAEGAVCRFGLEDGMKMVADAGFGAVDYSLTGQSVPWDEVFLRDPAAPEFREYFRAAAGVVAAHGLEIVQSHAPFCHPRHADLGLFTALGEQTRRAIYACAYMDCPYIVAHPVLHPDFNDGRDRERGRRINLEYFAGLVPALRETGVTLCIENLFWGDSPNPKNANIGSDGEQLIDLIDTLNGLYGPHFAACLDTGHALVVQQDPTEMLRALGSRVRVVHLHDNRGVLDDHLLPGMGLVDWQVFARALGESGFAGALNFELKPPERFFKWDKGDRALHRAAYGLLFAVGSSLAALVEEARQRAD